MGKLAELFQQKLFFTDQMSMQDFFLLLCILFVSQSGYSKRGEF